MAKRSTSFYLTEEVHELIRRLAEEQGTSMNQIVEAAVRRLPEFDSKYGKTGFAVGEQNTEPMEDLRDQVQFLRRELERKDTIIMSLVSRVPELEAASKPRESDLATENPDTGHNPRDGEHGRETSNERPWWLRILGG